MYIKLKHSNNCVKTLLFAHFFSLATLPPNCFIYLKINVTSDKYTLPNYSIKVQPSKKIVLGNLVHIELVY